jgi:hypothetical protein
MGGRFLLFDKEFSGLNEKRRNDYIAALRRNDRA